MRVKRGIVRHRRHAKIRSLAKGYLDLRRTTFVKANEAVLKAGQHAYRDRRLKKRTFRSLWIVRMNAAVRERGVSYAHFVKLLQKSGIVLNRKTLSELAIHHPSVFDHIVSHVGRKE